MSSLLPKPTEISGTTAVAGAATETTINVGRSTTTMVKINRVQIKRTAGAAANFTPLIGNVAAFTAAGTNQK